MSATMSVRAFAGARVAKPARATVVSGASRTMWYPGAVAPAHLDNSMEGDKGFDPLRLGANKSALPWYREGELTNGRWAMMAVAGIVFTDAVGLPKFWEAGSLTYALDFNTLAAVEIAVLALLEYKRYEGFKKTGETGLLSFFPFDPMGMRSDKTKRNELEHARLAMVAFLGICSQAAVRGVGPIDALKLHIEDPVHNNIFTSSVGEEATLAAVFISLAPIVIEAKNALSPDEKEEFNPIPW